MFGSHDTFHLMSSTLLSGVLAALGPALPPPMPCFSGGAVCIPRVDQFCLRLLRPVLKEVHLLLSERYRDCETFLLMSLPRPFEGGFH